jgi:acetyl-CoA C-acetyltransferase
MDEVAIVGWAQTEHRGAYIHETSQALIYGVVNEALSSCGLTVHDIDFIVDAGNDLLDGRGVSACVTVDAMGGHFKEEARVAGEGLLAAIYACMRIAGGFFSTGLVVAYGKSSESPAVKQSQLMCDPFYTRPLGLDASAAAAMQARAYMHKYGVSEAAPAGVAVKNRAAGLENGYALMRRGVSLQEVMDSPQVMSPIRELEAAPVTDGACAIVLADGNVSRAIKARRAWVSGLGHCTDGYSLGSRDLFRAASAGRAAAAAYSQAGIGDPARQLDLLEVTESFAHQELMLYEALGLCGEGEAEALLASGATAPGGATPVNVSGGALCANPVVATGLVRLAEACAQVTGRQEGARVSGAKRALAHGAGGLAMQSAACLVVER